jgi:hypothetical protein
MLKQKYRHTKPAHISGLQAWVYARDQAYVRDAMSRATFFGLDMAGIAQRIDVPEVEVLSWVNMYGGSERRRQMDALISQMLSKLGEERVSAPSQNDTVSENTGTTRLVATAFPSLADDVSRMVVGSIGDLSSYGWQV